MKIKMMDVVKLAAVLLQLEGVLASLSGEEQPEGEQQEKAEADKKLLLRCANLVVGEVAAEYLPLKAAEVLTSSDGNIDYSAFSKRPIEIYSAKKNGLKCRYKMYPAKLITEAGEVEVCYSYVPESVGIDEELDFAEGKITPRILAYGTAAEYCLVNCLHEEAWVWDKRYKDSLFGALRAGRAVHIPARRWL